MRTHNLTKQNTKTKAGTKTKTKTYDTTERQQREVAKKLVNRVSAITFLVH